MRLLPLNAELAQLFLEGEHLLAGRVVDGRGCEGALRGTPGAIGRQSQDAPD